MFLLSDMQSISRVPTPKGPYCELGDLIRLRYGARDIKLSKQKKTFSLLVGPHHTRFRGRGIEFEEVRVYHPGDDIRSIDWRVTARSGKAHTKLFREERERPVFILVDQSLPMFFGSRICFKSVIAAHTAAIFAWAAFQQDDRVGGLVFSGDEHTQVRPKRSTQTVLKLLSSINTFNHRLNRKLQPSQYCINRALEELRRIIRPGSNIYIISDFHQFDEEGKKHIFHMSRHNDIVAIHIFDKLEQHLPPAGYYSITNGRQHSHIFTGNNNFRRQYDLNFQERSDILKNILRPMGIPVIQISTLDSPLYYLKNLFSSK